MKKPLVPVTMKAVAAFKLDYLTSEAVELDIVDGLVVGVRFLTRAPDTFAQAVTQGQQVLWSTLKTNKPITRGQAVEISKPVKSVAKESK